MGDVWMLVPLVAYGCLPYFMDKALKFSLRAYNIQISSRIAYRTCEDMYVISAQCVYVGMLPGNAEVMQLDRCMRRLAMVYEHMCLSDGRYTTFELMTRNKTLVSLERYYDQEDNNEV